MTDKGNSHADRLEQALNNLEANKKAAATLFASIAPELERLAALNKKLETLPQSERRQVLDAVGLKHVSSAPKPITPLRGSSYRPPNKPPEPLNIDWRYWRHMPEVKQWEACALSMNINPDNVKPHPQGWMAGPGSGPLFTPASFPSAAAHTEFDKRLRLLGASLFKSGFFTAVNKLVVGGRQLATIRLQEFAAWGLHVELEKMPPELVAMAAPSKAGETKTAYADALETPEYQKTPEYQAKHKKALAILNEISEVEKVGIKSFDERERKNQKLAALEAELAALNQEPQLAPVVTAKRREKKPTIEIVALDYMCAEFKQGQFQSAAKFHKHLIKTAGLGESPFEMGTGVNARKLFCPDASSFFDEGTLGKIWAKIRAV